MTTTTINGRPTFRAGAREHAMLARKPRHGDPCNNCGLCCVASVCKLGQHVFKREQLPGPCPGLMQDDDLHYVCDVARNPQAYAKALSPSIKISSLRRAAMLIIGAGTGCDARFNGEQSSAVFDVMMELFDHDHATLLTWARKLWGMR